MNCRFGLAALIIGLTAVLPAAFAQSSVTMAPRLSTPMLLDSYVAVIGEDDLYNSSGTRLTRPAAILRQDRASYHSQGLRQRGDEGDRFFAAQDNRALLEGMLTAGRMSREAASAIVSGGATVRVEIWGRGSTGDYVTVEVY